MTYGKTLFPIATAVVAALCLGASPSSAATVQFTTSGVFVGPGASGSQIQAGTAILSFAGSSVNSNSFNPGVANGSQTFFPQGFGTFTLNAGTGNFGDNTSLFRLTITQIFAPVTSGLNPQTIESTIEGVVSTVGGIVNVSFPNSTTASFATATGPYVYDPVNETQVSSNSSEVLRGNITLPPGAPTIPLPPAVAGGIGLCSAMFGARRLKRRVEAV